VVAAAIDGVTGELVRRRLGSSPAEVLAWVRSLPGPVAVAYEAGPTGFTLARALRAGGVHCEVLAPSKLQRPVGERVKTDARDALHIAKLLRLGDIVSVTIPSESQEAARDLVRAREDARRDLMSARHRLGKLLLRRGIIYPDKTTWTTRHHAWLRQQRFELPGLQAAFDAAHEAVAAVQDRRARLDEAIHTLAAQSEFTSVVNRLACLRGVSTLTAFALAPSRSATGPGSTGGASARTSGSCRPRVPPANRAPRVGSPTPATPTRAACWSKRRGTTGRTTALPRRRCVRAGRWRTRKRASVGIRATCGSTAVGARSRHVANARSSRTPPSPASSPAGAGRWR
jgi:hypothetical protein